MDRWLVLIICAVAVAHLASSVEVEDNVEGALAAHTGDELTTSTTRQRLWLEYRSNTASTRRRRRRAKPSRNATRSARRPRARPKKKKTKKPVRPRARPKKKKTKTRVRPRARPKKKQRTGRFANAVRRFTGLFKPRKKSKKTGKRRKTRARSKSKKKTAKNKSKKPKKTGSKKTTRRTRSSSARRAASTRRRRQSTASRRSSRRASTGASSGSASSGDSSAGASSVNVPGGKLVWGKKVSAAFRNKVIQIAGQLSTNPNYLMAVMAFESGGTFSPKIKNAAGSGATGLIQFMPSTARSLGTSTSALARMSAVRQLDYVKKYLSPYKGKMTHLSDVYMAVLWPKAVGRSQSYVLFKRGTKAYTQNKGLDSNGDGRITKYEAAGKVRQKMQEGLRYAVSVQGVSGVSSGSGSGSSGSGGRLSAISDRWTPPFRKCLEHGGGFACFSKHGVGIPPQKCRSKRGMAMFACMEEFFMKRPVTSTNNPSHGSAAVPASGLSAKIYKAALAMKGTSSRSGPDGGRNACAWMVTKVLRRAGVRPVGKNTNYVPSVEAALKSGRGKRISRANAMPGDILISKGAAHIGVCLDKGCKKNLSNSSSRAKFVWVSDFNMGGYYNKYGGSPRVYRITSS